MHDLNLLPRLFAELRIWRRRVDELDAGCCLQSGGELHIGLPLSGLALHDVRYSGSETLMPCTLVLDHLVPAAEFVAKLLLNPYAAEFVADDNQLSKPHQVADEHVLGKPHYSADENVLSKLYQVAGEHVQNMPCQVADENVVNKPNQVADENVLGKPYQVAAHIHDRRNATTNSPSRVQSVCTTDVCLTTTHSKATVKSGSGPHQSNSGGPCCDETFLDDSYDKQPDESDFDDDYIAYCRGSDLPGTRSDDESNECGDDYIAYCRGSDLLGEQCDGDRDVSHDDDYYVDCAQGSDLLVARCDGYAVTDEDDDSVSCPCFDSLYWFLEPEEWQTVRTISMVHKAIADNAVDNLSGEGRCI